MKDTYLNDKISEDIRFINNYAVEKKVSKTTSSNLYSALLTLIFQRYYAAHHKQPHKILYASANKIKCSENYKFTLNLMSEEVKRQMKKLYKGEKL